MLVKVQTQSWKLCLGNADKRTESYGMLYVFLLGFPDFGMVGGGVHRARLEEKIERLSKHMANYNFEVANSRTIF